jgi:hypothetical protein
MRLLRLDLYTVLIYGFQFKFHHRYAYYARLRLWTVEVVAAN